MKRAPAEPGLGEQALDDYRVAVLSRQASLVGRREVMAGRAKFGIFGDGKEVPQVALARAIRPGDWHAGYYRDQTLMLAAGATTVRELFAQLYGDPDPAREPATGGRQMNNHFSSRFLDAAGNRTSQLEAFNSWPGFGAVAVQMSAMVGLAYASRLYRLLPEVAAAAPLATRNGEEVVFGAIGNASAAEGIFFEAVNAAAVLQVPLVISVWDDGYGISVPNRYQMARGSVSEALAGLQAPPGEPGMDVIRVDGGDYPALVDVYAQAAATARADLRPVLVHVVGITQPLGHSTSGSHERYKPPERIAWERENDPLLRLRAWLIETGAATEDALQELDEEATRTVEREARAAWRAMQDEIRQEATEARKVIAALAAELPKAGLEQAAAELDATEEGGRKLVRRQLVRAATAARGTAGPARAALLDHLRRYDAAGRRRYRSHLYSESLQSPLAVVPVPPEYGADAERIDGRLLLVRYWEQRLASDPRVFVIGEDVGRLGDVNLVYEGLQGRFGDLRLTDTGIREATILGQGIGAAVRGLRPIVDIQYLDYFMFALEIASDDLATLRYRSAGGQSAPVVIRTKGHRLVGMTHSGSPMGTILNACRGIRVCVPRDMTHAAGMYTTLLRGDDPGIVIEVLNRYRVKERVPANLSDFTVPLGMPEVLRQGGDVTLVTYGAMCDIALAAAATLAELGVDLEVIDVQTLNPFDIEHSIRRSVERTGALVVADEDVPGGTSAFIVDQVVREQDAFMLLDAAPVVLCGAENRPAYGGDGDYFTKPSADDIVLAVHRLMEERSPARFPPLTR